ncbi:imidazole glycerol phosphate synthase subunit HisH [Aliikangiella sp. IMCC44653]
MMKKVIIVNTRAGNLYSLTAAIERLGFEVSILDQPNNEVVDAIVIPGQGRFGTVIKNLTASGWEAYLTQAHQNNIPMLGICVGMQVFFEASEEDPEVKGLAWFKGCARKLAFPKKPMVGWAKLSSPQWPQAIVYFVNSFAVKQSDYSIAETYYGESFCAAVRLGSFTGVQFHPEKSSQAGLQIIRESLMGDREQAALKLSEAVLSGSNK